MTKKQIDPKEQQINITFTIDPVKYYKSFSFWNNVQIIESYFKKQK